MIAYPLGDSLYLNITNRCTNDCLFCIRRGADGMGGHRLWLKAEPTVDQILQAVGDPAEYREIVFCGFGEPTCRLDTLVAVTRALRPFRIPIRLDTNGHAGLIHGRDVWGDLRGIFDAMSISLNAATAAKYIEICRPLKGAAAYDAMLEFARRARQEVPKVTLTAVTYPGVDIDACKKVADTFSIPFRAREYQPPSGAVDCG